MSKVNEILKLKEERLTITTSIRGILDEGVELSSEKMGEVRKLEQRADQINERILVEERQLQRERSTGEKEEKREEKKDKDVEVRDAFVNYLRNGNEKAANEYRALQKDNPQSAGYLIAPEKFVNEIIQELDNALPFRQLCKVLPALVGAHSLGYPKRTARMNTAAWGGEITTPVADNSLAFGKREFKLNVCTGEILVSKTLLRNAPNVEEIVRKELAFNFGELLERAYMEGDGVGKPLGIFTDSVDGISNARDLSTGNTQTEIKFDGILNAIYNIKPQYQPNLKFLFHRDAMKQLRKLKDNDGQYIYQQDVKVMGGDTLFGIPVVLSEYCPAVFTTGKLVGILGDFKNYWILPGASMEVLMLQELYARSNQVDFVARMEEEGCPIQENAFCRIKLA